MIDDYLEERFHNKDFIYTINGRKAINIALSYYVLKKDDVVTILTTSGNFYISGCVTKEIEKFCRWSREIVDETRVILVNHEFGYPYKNLRTLKKYDLPIIEDCAHSFFSYDKNNDIGNVGEFVIYSFPKMFPLQIGGLLVSNISGRIETEDKLHSKELRHIKNVLSTQIGQKEEIILDRINNYKYLRNRFKLLGLSERFKLDEGIIPGVFMFKTDDKEIDLPKLKQYFYAHGVQCSVFYGENAFFIPVHQALCEQDMDYFSEVLISFLNNSEDEIFKY